MSHIIFDPDEWETATQHGGPGPMSWLSISQRRPPEVVAQLKAERRRVEENEILRRADEIRARRYQG